MTEKIFLLADDDADDTQLFCEALEDIDPSIVCYCAADGKKVMEILENKELEKPQVIFLDINMPGMNGWECLAQLKNNEAYRHIPVLIYSTSSHQKEANLALDLGALCFFTKPSDFIELKGILKVLAANMHGNLTEAVSHFNAIKSKKVFACSDENTPS
ncbi:MAG TPA: response regulator [Flavisolibacter sp.]|nr:response regulator [Flavisolibacter sp.]